MTVYWNKSRRMWMYGFVLLGERYQGYCIDPETGPARSRRRAREIEEDIRSAERKKRSGGVIVAGAFTIAEACAAHLSTAESPSYRKRLTECIAELVAYFGADTAVTSITGPKILAYRTWCAEQTVKVWVGGPGKDRPRDAARFWKDTGKPRSTRTCNRYLDALSGALGKAHTMRDENQKRYLEDVPNVPRFHEPKRKPTPLRDVDLDAIEGAARPWIVDGLELARLFGLRHTTEIVAVTVDMVDDDVRGLRLPPEITKSSDEQIVMAGASGWALLTRLRDQALARGTCHLVTWPGVAGMHKLRRGEPVEKWFPLKSFRKGFNGARKRAGLDTGRRRWVHDVRARFITEVSSSTKSAEVVQGAARHADYKTTQLYIELAQEEMRAAIEAADARRPERAANTTVNVSGAKALTEVTNAPKRPRVVRDGKT
ncbi:hypothetical protein [Vineibacter terrae]|uniref:hypothetical protein n=1 Tax=Vineibacter terrae TaxID=2586908 RepID=UPI002E36C503|nr:hypothetical protein [Vineibacter terrae]HEX2886630.1 hypothetical protein [Vineibacter terrae]